MVNSQAITSLFADIGYFVSSTASKKATTSLGVRMVTFMTILFNIVPVAVAIAIVGIGPSLSTVDILLSVVAGGFFILGFFLIYISLHTEQLTNTMALGTIWPAILVVFSIVFLGESLTVIEEIAILLIFGGMIFIITTEGMKINRKLIPAIMANISWGVYWIMLTYVIQGSGNFAMPILITRIVGIAILFAYILSSKTYMAELKKLLVKATRNPSHTFVFILVLGVLVGFGDSTGDTIIASVIQLKTSAIAGAIAALNPVFVSIFAYFAYKDRLKPLQYFGFAAMIAGAVILSLS